jgi:glycosyltransferase involved in cell wall biosynthesis
MRVAQPPRVLLVSMGSPAKSSFVARSAWLKNHPGCEFEVAEELGWPYEAGRTEREEIFRNLLLAKSKVDVVLLHRVLFEKPYRDRFFADEKPVIFDFDDAIYAIPSGSYRSELRTASGCLKRIWRLATRGRPDYGGRFRPLVEMLKRVDAVSVGNPHLARFASRHCPHVTVIPTVVDAESFPVKTHSERLPVTIGWYGSPDNHWYLGNLANVFQSLHKNFGAGVRFETISSARCESATIPIHWTPWNPALELMDLTHFDIGVMPLSDDEWARGKCANKAIYYMAAGIPPVVSPIGVNAEIVIHGESGFHASNDKEWLEHLSLLITDAKLRAKVGLAARNRALRFYSRPILAEAISTLVRRLTGRTNFGRIADGVLASVTE